MDLQLRKGSPDIHSFPPPWEVPRKRKPRGTPRGGRDCYDPVEGNIYFLGGENISTQNRYSLLRDANDDMKEVLHSSKRMPDSSPTRKRKKMRTVYFENYEEFYKKNSDIILFDLFNNSKCIMYSNKYNMCSGYFPDFILSPNLDREDYNGGYSNNIDNNAFSNDSPNFNYDNDNYYPHFRNGKYSKQISNANSKYNNSYFYKLRPAYKICKKFWEPFHNSKYVYKNSSNNNAKSQFLYPPDYERVVKSSERGTLGDYKEYNDYNNYNNFNKHNHLNVGNENKINNTSSNIKGYRGGSNYNYVLNSNSRIYSNNNNKTSDLINYESKMGCLKGHFNYKYKNNSDGKHPPRQSPNSERGDMGDLGGNGCRSNYRTINNVKGVGVGNYNSSRSKYSISNERNNNNLNSNHNNKTIVGNSQFPSKHKPDHSDQLFGLTHKDNMNLHTKYGEVKNCRKGNQGGVGQFLPHHNRCKSGQHDQYPGRDHTLGNTTPRRGGTSTPRRRL